MIMETVIHDLRAQQVPKPKVCILPVSSRTRSRILQARGAGKILTFKQLDLGSPEGGGPGPHRGRGALAFQQGPRDPPSHTNTYLPSTGQKFKHIRGQRASPGFKANPSPTFIIKKFWMLKKRERERQAQDL